ncbi:MAG: hypothetical protein ACM3NN_01500 [Nitrospirota bacterium]
MKSRNTIFATISLAFGFFVLLSLAQAVSPAPDGCYPGFTTAEGCNALNFLTSGAGNTAVGWYSLYVDSTGSFNTGVGAGALDLNNGNENTAVGTGSLLLNSTGENNTAVGAFALVNSTDGNGSTAVGDRALQNATSGPNTATGSHALIANTTGINNAAFGVHALQTNIDGISNTAIGNSALDLVDHGSANTAIGRHAGDHITTGNNNVCVGTFSGTGITTGSNIITIGPVSGVHSVFGQGDNRTYIANIINGFVDSKTAQAVYVDADGRLGTVPAAAEPELRLPGPATAKPNLNDQTMLNRKVEALEIAVAELREQLKEQASQIRKVSVQLQLNKFTGQTISNNQSNVR